MSTRVGKDFWIVIGVLPFKLSRNLERIHRLFWIVPWLAPWFPTGTESQALDMHYPKAPKGETKAGHEAAMPLL